MSMTFNVPLRVSVSKKKDFILNMNNYRNAHFRVLDKAKKLFHKHIKEIGLPEYQYERVRFIYNIYPESKRKFDLMNVVSVIDKFTMDAVVEIGIIQDDNFLYVPKMPIAYIHTPDGNPRCEVTIEELD